MHEFGDALRQRLERHLAGFDVHLNRSTGLRRAAVAMVVAPGPDGRSAALLLTLRPATIGRHAGQYALPGGRIDEGESVRQTALRELHEELGVQLTERHFIGRLDDYATRSGFVISPMVLCADGPLVLKPAPDEVAKVYHVPLEELESPDIPILSDGHEADGPPVLSAWLPCLGHRIYAPTAAILYQFREVALAGRTTRVSHFDQPAFAWK